MSDISLEHCDSNAKILLFFIFYIYSLFKTKFKLDEYRPSPDIFNALTADSQSCIKLTKTCEKFQKYADNHHTLEPETMSDIFTVLLNIADVDNLKDFVKLKQRWVKLRSFGDDYSMRVSIAFRYFILQDQNYH